MDELAKRLREAANWRLDDLGTDGAREVASLLTEAAAALSAQSDAKLTREEIEDLKNEICPENGWIKTEIPRFHALCDMALAALSGVRVPVEPTEDDPIVGHKTMADGSHIPLRKKEADTILARVELAEEQRRAAMPDEQSAINTMFNGWLRLKDFGWREAIYCPKDGSPFNVLECGSTGIHTAHYSGDWPEGTWWIEADNDLWPSRPVLFKPLAAAKGER